MKIKNLVSLSFNCIYTWIEIIKEAAQNFDFGQFLLLWMLKTKHINLILIYGLYEKQSAFSTVLSTATTGFEPVEYRHQKPGAYRLPTSQCYL